MSASPSIRVLVVDDSALVRKAVCESLAPFADIQVVGTAVDPYVARQKILELNPDVITLDVEMPRMDGLTFLKIIMKHRPCPVIIMSSLTSAGSEKALEALQAGAVDVLDKPNGALSVGANGTILAEKIRAAARANLKARACSNLAPPRAPRPALPGGSHPRGLILIGASTGGTEALKVVLRSMSGTLPCICIVQHIPGYFSKAFAARLNEICPMEVREAAQGDRTRPGLALVAPGGFHMLLQWEEDHYAVRLTEGPPVHHQRPSVDILFESAVKAGAAPYSSAALLTGMGADGARGLLRLRQAGARTIAQNEATCVVYGMPREAANLGAAEEIEPLEEIGSRLEAPFLRPGLRWAQAKEIV